MTGAAPNFELLLRQALVPVDPPEHLIERVEATLTSLTELAAEELESWELSAMRDPRNWIRPAAALVVGTTAGAGLVVLGVRHRQHQRRPDGLAAMRAAVTRILHDAEVQARRRLDRR